MPSPLFPGVRPMIANLPIVKLRRRSERPDRAYLSETQNREADSVEEPASHRIKIAIQSSFIDVRHLLVVIPSTFCRVRMLRLSSLLNLVKFGVGKRQSGKQVYLRVEIVASGPCSRRRGWQVADLRRRRRQA